VRIQTFSIVVGTKACNARCPFCVSRMTGFEPVIGKSRDINDVNLEKACRLAQVAGTTTVLLTGKGEPTLYPDEITRYLQELEPWKFPFIELQTNAIRLGQLAIGDTKKAGFMPAVPMDWRLLGLNTIAISAVSERREENQAVYGEDYGELAATIAFLKELGFTVRLCIMMHQGAVDTPQRFEDVIAFCKRFGADQLTVRPIRKPTATKDEGASAFVAERGLTPEQEDTITGHIRGRGTKLLSLMHGAEVYDIDGQNVCLADCLTLDASGEDLRSLIFYSDGRLCYDWQYEGAVLLGGGLPANPAVRTRLSPMRK